MTDTELLKLTGMGVAVLLREQHHEETKEGIYADNAADLLADRLDLADKIDGFADSVDGMK